MKRKGCTILRDKLIDLIVESVHGCARHWAEIIADHLIYNGVKLSNNDKHKYVDANDLINYIVINHIDGSLANDSTLCADNIINYINDNAIEGELV